MSSGLQPAAYSSSSSGGMMRQVGQGRVMSLVMTTIFSPGFTISRSRGAPMGSPSARATSSSFISPRGTSLDISTPIRFFSGTSTVCTPVPNPNSNFICLLPIA